MGPFECCDGRSGDHFLDVDDSDCEFGKMSDHSGEGVQISLEAINGLSLVLGLAFLTNSISCIRLLDHLAEFHVILRFGRLVMCKDTDLLVADGVATNDEVYCVRTDHLHWLLYFGVLHVWALLSQGEVL